MSSQLQHKLQQFEATPPKDAWLAIEDRLNNIPVQERLYNYEATPPAMAWNEIAASLDQASPIILQTNPIHKKKWFRLAAAAAILGIVALGILTYAINKPETAIAKQPLIKQQQTRTPATTSTPAPGTSTHNDVETIIPIKEESISVPASTSDQDPGTTVTKRYKVVANEDGQMVRLSQKAYAVFDCAVKGVAQKNTNCKENIQTMQAKMASSLVTPTTDFAGLIDMIKTLEENK